MCFQPIKIRNKSKYFNIHKDKLFLYVPCGHCGECLQQTRNDWKVRAYYEWDSCKKSGGNCYFITLTYNEDHIPHTYVNGKEFNCFSKSDVQLFFKRLRNRIKKRFNTDIKYLVCSEYGGRYHRPHMHLLLFVNGQHNYNSLHDIVAKSWSKDIVSYVPDCHGHTKIKHNFIPIGFIKFGANHGIVSGVGAIKYVTKYICKDIDFQNTFQKVYLSSDIEAISKMKEFEPYHHASIGFGISAVNTNPDNLLDGRLYVPDTDPNKCYVNLPLYLQRKLFYHVEIHNDNPVYVLNQSATNFKYSGVDMKIHRLQKHFDSLQESLDVVCHGDVSMSPEVLNNLNRISGVSFQNFEHFQRFCRSLLGDHSYEEVFSYLTSYRDSINIDGFSDLPSLLDSSFDKFVNDISDKTFVPYELSFEDGVYWSSMTYNSLPCFQDFELLLKMLSYFKNVIGYYRQSQYTLQEYLYSQLRKNY